MIDFFVNCAIMLLFGVGILLGNYFGTEDIVLAGGASIVVLVTYRGLLHMCKVMGVREGIKGLHIGMLLGFLLGAGLIGVFAKEDPIGLVAVAWFYCCTFSAMGGVAGAIVGIAWPSHFGFLYSHDCKQKPFLG